ncbi:MAG: hypothetical protein WCV90_01305 [Candidatus Woesearchaeota archaeon]
MTYTITVLPDTPESKYQVIAQAGEVSHNIIHRLLIDPSADRNKGLNLVNDLLSARYWGTLGALDGPSQDGFYQYYGAADFERLKPARVEAQKWATTIFAPYDLEKLLNVAVNQALLQPIKTCKPGTTLGHAHIYDHLVFNPDSQFKEALTPELKERLNNGRFWECLPQAHSGLFLGIVRDSLNEGGLSLDFIPYGLRLMKASNEDRPISNLRLELLGDGVLAEYFSFLERAYLKGNIGEDFYPLVREGVFALVKWDRNDDAPFVKNFKKQLRNPFVQMYLSASSELRSDLAWEMQPPFADEYYQRFQEKVVSAIPDSGGFLRLLSRKRD